MSADEDIYLPKVKVSKGKSFRRFLYNSETGAILGRTCGSWARLLVFYCIFYTCVASFSYGIWCIFFKMAIKMDKPRYQQKESLIGANPGLGYRPMPMGEHVESSLIWFKRDDNNYLNWTRQLKTFLRPYEESMSDPVVVDCSHNQPAPFGKVCRVPLEKMKPCHQEPYEYNQGHPCIFLKLNKIFNWIPVYYNESKDIPSSMPAHLKRLIAEKSRNGPSSELNTVWISCEGENPADKENIGPLHYRPDFGFPGFYFPFNNTKGYLSPIVAVWLENPRKGVLINIECKAWARNIEYDRHDRRGSVHFEIMID